MMLVPSVSQYRTKYYFYVHKDATNANIVLIVEDTKTTGMLLSGNVATLNQLWTSVPNTVGPVWKTNSLRVNAGQTYILQNVDGAAKFGAYMYQEFGSTCSALQNVGYCLHTLTDVSVKDFVYFYIFIFD